MDLKEHALYQQVCLEKLEKVLQDLQRKLLERDAALIDAEVEMECQKQVLLESEERLKKAITETKHAEMFFQEKQKGGVIFQQQVDFLSDYLRWFTGKLFRHNTEGAAFFTQAMSDFAYQKGIGELSLLEILKSSTDGCTMVLQGKMYCYLKAADGLVYFHPEAVPEEFFEVNYEPPLAPR